MFSCFTLVTAANPDNKLKAVEWKKLNDNELANTFWTSEERSNVDQAININSKQLEKWFSDKRPAAKARPAPVVVKKANDLEYLVDQKTSMNLAIILNQFGKLPVESIAQAIRDSDFRVLTADRLDALLAVLPPTSVMESISTYQGEIEKLHPPDQFMHQISFIPGVITHLDALRVMNGFDEKILALEERIHKVLETCTTLMHSKPFHRFLYVVLKVGNYMNSGTGKAHANAFRLDSLAKLATIRTNRAGSRMTMLHHVMNEVDRLDADTTRQMLRDFAFIR
jgi:hypothetical protein